MKLLEGRPARLRAELCDFDGAPVFFNLNGRAVEVLRVFVGESVGTVLLGRASLKIVRRYSLVKPQAMREAISRIRQ